MSDSTPIDPQRPPISPKRAGGSLAPPPPVGIGLYARKVVPVGTPEEPKPEPKPTAAQTKAALDETRSRLGRASVTDAGRPFDAELDLSEVDDRLRPGATWPGRAVLLSRSTLVLTSRRMCYIDRMLILAVHLIDSEPVPLCGRVVACEYEGDGRYSAEIELAELPESRALDQWLGEQTRNAMRRNERAA